MESTEQNDASLRERMRRAGVPVWRLANEAQMYPNDMYRVLAGGPVGPVRRARIAEAAKRLGLMDDNEQS